MEDNARRECRVALGRSVWGVGCTLAVLSKSQSRHEIVLAAQSNGASSTMTLRLIVGRARGTRVGRVIDSRNTGKVQSG